MKKLMIAALMCLTVAAASAQDFRIGAKGAFNSTWLFNNNISDQGNVVDYASTFGASFGLSSQLYFNENLGVLLDILYSSNNQNLEGEILDEHYESTTKVKYLDLPLLLRISSEGGAYVEFGPQFSLLMGAKEDLAFDHPLPTDYTDRDVKDYFNGFGIAPILGFGVDISASDNLLINIGLRFGYGVSDATVKRTEAELDALTDDQHSFYGDLAHTNADNEYSYQKTNRAFGGFTLGIIYKPNN